MNELYWITIFGRISDIVHIFFTINIIILGITLFAYLVACGDVNTNLNGIKKCIKISTICLIIFTICNAFIPNTKELYVIYGVGGTIDYLKDNDKAKQLPDKCIDALDKYLNEFNENKE